MKKLWKDIKEEYKEWPVNEYGYYVSQDGFWFKIGDGAKIGDQAEIGNRAEIGVGAKIGDRAKIGVGAKISKPCLTYIIGSMHQCYLYDPAKKIVGIGCEVHTISHWQENFRKIGESYNYSEKQISEYKKYIDLFSASFEEGGQ